LSLRPLLVVSLMLFLSATSTIAQTNPLAENYSAASEDIIQNGQDQMGNATPVITGKNQAAASVGGQTEQQTRLLNPVSNWILSLMDSQDRSVSLQMSQSNNVVFGKGTIDAEGSSQGVSATGTITGTKVNLDVLTDDLTLFRLSLTMSGSSLSGDYHGYSPTIVAWKGIAMGKIS